MNYEYETVAKPHRRFELQHSMKDPSLTHHPETGEPIRRVITGGSGFKKTCFNNITKLTMDDCKGSSLHAAAANKPLTLSVGAVSK